TLASGERARIPLLVINPPTPWAMLPGNYTLSVTASSLSNPKQSHKAEFPADFLTCYALAVWPEPTEQAVCEERELPSFNFTIRNSGKWPEPITATASTNKASSSQELSIPAGEQKTLAVTPREPVRGENTVTVAADSQVSYATAKASAKLTVNNCYDFSAKLEPAQATACLNSKAAYTLTVTNNARDDAFTVEAPAFLRVENRSFKLAGGQQEQLTVTADVPQIGSLPFTITVIPSSAPAERKELSGTLTGSECRDASLALSLQSVQACSGDPVNATVTLTNRGAVRDTFSLNSSHGTLTEAAVTLDPSKNRTLQLRIPTAGMTGERSFVVTATGEVGVDGNRAQAQAALPATIDLCYAATLTASPRNATVCPGREGQYALLAENAGTRTDTFRVSLEGQQAKQAILEPRRSQALPFSIAVPADAPAGVRTLTAQVRSSRFSGEAQLSLTVAPAAQCFQLKLADGAAKAVAISRAAAFRVRLENPGLASQNVTLSVADGPSWVYPIPEAVNLVPKSSADLYVYIVPPLGTGVSNHTATLVARSAETRVELPLDIRIVATINETVQPENITDLDTGLPVTGRFLSLSSSERVMAAAIVGLIAIAILAFRFLVLGRRRGVTTAAAPEPVDRTPPAPGPAAP
ncbi:MAG TPA: hypothetical protein VJB16_06825, partial [archaeon]|nr:hypothetical protein [archaeon]